jgi:TonB family protein
MRLSPLRCLPIIAREPRPDLAYVTDMEQATLRKFVSISVLFHGGLFGLLLLLSVYSPPFSDRPLKVRLIGPPETPGLPAPAPPASSEPSPRLVPPARAEKAPEPVAPPVPPKPKEVERPAPPAKTVERPPAAPEKPPAKTEVKPPPAPPAPPTPPPAKPAAAPPAPTPPAAPAAKVEPPPAARSGTSQPTQENPVPGTESREAKAPPPPPESTPASKPPPRVASLPPLPPVELPRSLAPEAPRESSRPPAPEAARVLPPTPSPGAGLSLGGASKELGPPPAPGGSAASRARPARPSIRDQIASLGSGEWAEGQGSAKQTIDLDNREPQYVDYLALLKRRIERVWGYPPEAANNGISGDLLLIFTLNKSGSLIDLRLIRSSGFPVLDEAAIRAVKLAAPYDPFPAYMGSDPWNIRASFTYYLPYGFRRY